MKFKVDVQSISLLMLLIASNSLGAPMLSDDVCISIKDGGGDSVIRATSPEARLEVTTNIINGVSPTILSNIPGDKLTGNSTNDLEVIYTAIAESFGQRATVVGFNHFVEAVNEISVAQAEACNVSVSYNSSDVRRLSREFKLASDEQDANLQKIRTILGTILCIDSGGPDGARKRRQTVEDKCPARDECSCPEEGVEGDNGLPCTCQFLKCVGRKARFIKQMFGLPILTPNRLQCLAFVVDTTGSMANEIDAAKRIINEFVQKEADLGLFGCYLLVPFNDYGIPSESAGPVTIAYSFLTDKVMEFLTAVNDLSADGGGDYPEYAIRGMLLALDATDRDSNENIFRLMTRGSQMVVITDATSKQPELADTVISRANGAKVCVHFFLSEDPTGDGVYPKIHEQTHGSLSTFFEDFALARFVSTYKQNPCSFSSSGTNNNNNENIGKRASDTCKRFQVSKLAVLLKLSIQAATGSIVSITRPNGTASLITVSGGDFAVFSEGRPQDGNWSACVDGGAIELSVTEQSSFDTTVFYQREDSEDTSLTLPPALTEQSSFDTTVFYQREDSEDTSLTLPPACSRGKIAMVTTRSTDIDFAMLNFINRDGEIARSVNLTKCSTSGLLVSDTLYFPQGSFTYQLDGLDTNGVRFYYDTEKNITFPNSSFYSNGHDPLIVIDGTAEAAMDINDTLTLNYTIENTAQYASLFTIKAKGVSELEYRIEPPQVLVHAGDTAPIKIAVRVLDSTITRGIGHKIEIIASDGCINISTPTFVTVRPPPNYISISGVCVPASDQDAVVVQEREPTSVDTKILYLARGSPQPSSTPPSQPGCLFDGRIIVVSPHVATLQRPYLELVRTAPYPATLSVALTRCGERELSTHDGLIFSFAGGTFRFNLVGFDSKRKKLVFETEVTATFGC